jgi:hypothetical protein
MKFKQAWVLCKRSSSKVATLKSCFIKLADAMSRINKSMEVFWLLDVSQLTVNTITGLGRIITADTEAQKGKNWNQFLVTALCVTRLLILAFVCGDTSEKVRLQVLAMWKSENLYFNLV